MKKLFCIILLSLLVLCVFTACSGKDGKDGIDGQNGIDGTDGETPTIEISEDGYWIINGEKTDLKASSDKIDHENPQGLQFFMQDDGTYLVSCGDAKYLSNIVIPTTYKGGAVVGIVNDAFYANQNLTSITIPDTVTKIGARAFSNCPNLTSVMIGDGVTSIGEEAFYTCSNLTSVVIGDSVTNIGECAFAYCTSLTSVNIPNSVKSIGEDAFYFCTSLTGVYISNLAAWCNIFFETLYSNPLNHSKNLYLNGELVTDLVVPDGVTSIGQCAFFSCTSIETVVIPDSVTAVGDAAFSGCDNLKSAVISTGVTSIGKYAFATISDVYYTGSEEEWNVIEFDPNVSAFVNPTIHYNYVPEA